MTKSILALLIGALIVPSANAADAPVMPKDLPAYAADKPLPVPEIAKRTLANGLTVWVVARDGMPRVDYVLAFKNAGLAADEATTPGFASTLAGLLSEGSEQRDSKAIAETAQSYGGGVAAFASNDGLIVSADALASNAGPMLGLLAEIVRQPSFPEQEIALAKANALQGLKAAEAQPGFRAERAILKAVYGEHPYARTQTTEAGINAITRDALVAAYRARLRPDQALLVVAGRIDANAAFVLAQQRFGDWQVEGKAAAATSPSASSATRSFVHLERTGSVQSALRIGRPAVAATDADYIALRVTSTILGGGFSSRLMQNLREDKGYTYGAGLGYRAQMAGGALIAAADVRNEVTGAALGEFFAEYKRIGAEVVSASELDMNKRYIAGGYLIGNQLQGAVAGSLANNWLVGLPPEFLGEFVPKVRAVDAAQVQAIGKKYFAPEQQSIVVVGDAAVVAQLKGYGTFADAK
ncbi:MAG: insulinase family protein [Rhodanobacteraceae bacterium]|nr:insulinase family protein [Rhodanobacteraceae bacterium]